MFGAVSILAALVGVALAAFGALAPDTGVNGTLGAYLALLGALAVTVAVLILIAAKPGSGVRDLLIVAILLAASLTAIAAWFLMQNWLICAMVVATLALLFHRYPPQKRAVR